MEQDTKAVERMSQYRRLNSEMKNNKKPRENKITPEMKAKHDKMSNHLFDKLYKEEDLL